jgi:hypothetical protein
MHPQHTHPPATLPRVLQCLACYNVLQESLSQNLSGTLSEPSPRTLRDTTPRPAPLWAAHTPATRELYVASSMASYGICEAQDTHKRQLADVNAWHEHARNRC